MPRQAKVKSRTGIYHLIWRGVNRQEIFHDEDYRKMFMDILQKYKLKFNLSVYAWCLMSNHVHLLMKEGDECISGTMKRIGVSYVGYYNWKYRTTGHLFQDRFSSENVETSLYFRTVVRYIHQNPVKARKVMRPDKWKWSSCQKYYGQKISPQGFLEPNFLLMMFSSDIQVAQEQFKAFNEKVSDDQCLEDKVYEKRITDEEARMKIKQILDKYEIPEVKSLPKEKRNEIVRKVKGIE